MPKASDADFGSAVLAGEIAAESLAAGAAGAPGATGIAIRESVATTAAGLASIGCSAAKQYPEVNQSTAASFGRILILTLQLWRGAGPIP
jgi:hypothetical protein